MITQTQLQTVITAVMPSCREPFNWAIYLHDAMQFFGITADERVDDFLAQIAVESRELNTLTENLSYSADRLMEVWPKRFPTPADADRCAHNPQALAEKVYGGRLGNTNPGDGWRYRGRGLIMVTFADNYRHIGQLLGYDLLATPQVLETPHFAAMSAAAYWKDRGLNALAEANDVVSITRLIQGGHEGLTKRQAYKVEARKALGLS